MRISRVKGIGYTANQASPSLESPVKQAVLPKMGVIHTQCQKCKYVDTFNLPGTGTVCSCGIFPPQFYSAYNSQPCQMFQDIIYTQTLLYRGISFIAAFAYHLNLWVQRHLAIVYIQHIGG